MGKKKKKQKQFNLLKAAKKMARESSWIYLQVQRYLKTRKNIVEK